MPETASKSPLVQALEKKREAKKMPETDKLLQMILEQITKMNNYFLEDDDEDKNENDIVTTQESHRP